MTVHDLNPDKALIFRITHRDNLPWILDHGLYARSSQLLDPGFRRIGDFDLIDKRPRRGVPTGLGGTLSDYIPFYFTPLSIMACNIHTGYRGVEEIPNEDLAILVSSLHKISEAAIPFVFTDAHAYMATARYFTDVADLKEIDWVCLRNRDFAHDPDNPRKKDRYQAEALVWKHLPVESLVEISCCGARLQQEVEAQLEKREMTLKATIRRDWYF